MKIILLQDIDSLGVLGDEVIVKDGFARNFLLPQKIAIESSKGSMLILEQKKRTKERQEKKIKEECEQIAEKIKNVSCTIEMEAGEDDKLFGSVTSENIADCLHAEGIEIDKKKIILEEPLKTLGVFSVDIKLHAEVQAQARIWVVKK